MLRIILFLASFQSVFFLVDGANVRLVNGKDSCSGRVEIYHEAQWGTVCHDYWNLKNAEVVCKQLGCGRAVAGSQNVKFSPGRDPIWLDDVHCSGSESSITDCLHDELGSHNCGHDEDVGVLCSGRTDVRLVNGVHRCCGRVEVQYRAQWGRVCDNNWDLHDADVVCKQLGCGRAVSASNDAHFGPGEEAAWLDEVQCNGTESFIDQCVHSGLGVKDCDHEKDVGIVCAGDLLSPALSQISSDSVVSPGEIIQFRCASPNPTCISVDFRLYKTGSLIETQTAQSETTFTLTVDSSHQGQYTCDYTYGQSSSMTSSRSNSISISVASSQAYFIASGVAAGLLLIFLPVIICFVKKQKRRKDDEPRGEISSKSLQEEDKTDDSPDYENAEIIFCNSRRVQTNKNNQKTLEDINHEEEHIYQN